MIYDERRGKVSKFCNFWYTLVIGTGLIRGSGLLVLATVPVTGYSLACKVLPTLSLRGNRTPDFVLACSL